MNERWNLDILYTGLDDPSYEKDVAAATAASGRLAELTSGITVPLTAETAEQLLLAAENYAVLISRLAVYLNLRISVDTEDGAAKAQFARIMRIDSQTAAASAAVQKLLGGIEDPEALAASSPVVRDYLCLIRRAREDLSHMLSNEEEALASAMDATGGSAWGDLQAYLTSTVSTDFDGKPATLTELRNLASSPDPSVRRAAYEAELACYPKIQDSVAFALNNIKNQVIMLAEKRGFASPLDQALHASRMDRKTLDALMSAIEEYLPHFRRYLRKKAEKLGYSDGLPWFELFAPLGDSHRTFTTEQARDYLLTCFRTLSPEIADVMRDAFDNAWIDFFPRSGKSGGAFDCGLPEFKQSRVMTNFDGSFAAVDTLAHELGHAFHDRQVQDHRPMNTDYPMPVAETASTFNEVHLGNYALAQASDEEKLALLESDLKESTQCIMDIYSRYLFETAVFDRCRDQFLMAADLNELMLDCQRKAYGEGLDSRFMNSGMWVCKSHYYSSGLSFYNFPYAFGNLFAVGLYALYLDQPDSFMERYKTMLRETPIHTMEENGAVMGIDLTDRGFWIKSLELLKAKIDAFCAL
ncbi:MAG: M3 family oligoendopeptidase [Oscillospiraceae bacterium]|nr:M3 family oligoendopeptidase [Oscillospiraceae bacterium]